MARSTVVSVAALIVIALLGGCGEADPQVGAGDEEVTGVATDGPVGNACPAEGCRIEIVDVAEQDNELQVTWQANFEPDVSRNHIHVYWDTFTADQVSVDADARGVETGEWSVTDAHPEYVTEGAASVAERGDATALCVTAGDRDHLVIDAELVDCRDVADALDR